MRSIQEIKDALAREHGYEDWHQLWQIAPAQQHEELIAIAMSNYAFESRQQLVREMKKTLSHLPEALRLIEETEWRTYPNE